MNQTLLGILLILATEVCLLAYFTALVYLFPRRTAATAHFSAYTRGRAFAVGLVNLLFFGLLALVMASAGGGDLLSGLAILLAAALLWLISLGLAGQVRIIAQMIYPPASAGSDQIPPTAYLRASLLLSLACLLPVLGWFLLLPYLAILALGSAILSLFQKAPGM